jgi:DNA-3-methyladenine glycosylase
MNKLSPDYFRENDTLWLAADLLGKILISRSHDGITTTGWITETEAYLGITDKASHAYGNRLTPRTSTMYLPGGVAYVYLCYGIHFLFNIVTERENIPNAVLIRGIYAHKGKELMGTRTGKTGSDLHYDGPGKLTKAMGIDLSHNNEDLTGNRLWLEKGGISIAPDLIIKSPRIGVDYAGEDAKLPYRFRIHPSAFNGLI